MTRIRFVGCDLSPAGHPGALRLASAAWPKRATTRCRVVRRRARDQRAGRVCAGDRAALPGRGAGALARPGLRRRSARGSLRRSRLDGDGRRRLDRPAGARAGPRSRGRPGRRSGPAFRGRELRRRGLDVHAHRPGRLPRCDPRSSTRAAAGRSAGLPRRPPLLRRAARLRAWPRRARAASRLPRDRIPNRAPGIWSEGIRAKVGAWHLPLGVFLHAFLDAGLVIERFEEPEGRDYPYIAVLRARR